MLQEFISGRYAPHGYCLLWQPELVWTHVVSDALIAAAYFSIPIALVRFVRRRGDVQFGWMIWLFALFILACGTTHLMSIWNLWHGDYGIEAIVKAITAAASVPTAILLWRLIPHALAIPSPNQLQSANDKLSASVAARDEMLQKLQTEIAQRERAEAALVQAQKLDAVGQLTAGIAHDFNNLLQAVGGNLDLIRNSPTNAEKIVRWSDNANKGVARGRKLTGQLLAFSRTQRLELRPIDVNAMITNMQELVRSSIGSLVAYESELEPDLCHVCGDITQLELAVLNLAINARDAMPEGGTLKVITRAIALGDDHDVLPAGKYVELIVADTGSGMPPEVIARAVDPFFTTKGVGAGTGLGLSMAFGVAKQSGGTLRIESDVDEGTRISLVLRCIEAHEAVSVLSQPTAVAAQADLHGMMIAVVDDDPDVRQFVVDCLANQGAMCCAFESGEAFVHALPGSKFDLALVDFAMPGMNGSQVAAQARSADQNMPIVIMTGYADSDAIDELEQNIGVLRKPFTVGQLLVGANSAKK